MATVRNSMFWCCRLMLSSAIKKILLFFCKFPRELTGQISLLIGEPHSKAKQRNSKQCYKNAGHNTSCVQITYKTNQNRNQKLQWNSTSHIMNFIGYWEHNRLKGLLTDFHDHSWSTLSRPLPIGSFTVITSAVCLTHTGKLLLLTKRYNGATSTTVKKNLRIWNLAFYL